jgi:hypothetical protein
MIKLQEEHSKTFVTKYNNRDTHLDLSLYQYFNLLKNNNSTKKEIAPQYVRGSGQPTYPVTKQYVRAE